MDRLPLVHQKGVHVLHDGDNRISAEKQPFLAVQADQAGAAVILIEGQFHIPEGIGVPAEHETDLGAAGGRQRVADGCVDQIDHLGAGDARVTVLSLFCCSNRWRTISDRQIVITLFWGTEG